MFAWVKGIFRRIRRWTLLLVALGLALGVVVLVEVALGPPALEVPPRGVVLSGLTVVNPGLDRRPDHSLVVRGDRIASIPATAPPGASDAYAGGFALPGLVDLHVHHPPVAAVGERELFAALFLLHGVTSVRDTGSFDGTLLSHKRRLDSGALAGPRLFACGSMVDGDPPGWPGARVVRGAADAPAAVQALAREGVDCIKVYNGLSLESFNAVRAAAAEHRLPVVAHVPDALSFDAMRGVEVQHLMGLTEDWSRRGQPLVERYVRHSRRFGIRHTPTLVTFARGAQLDRYPELLEDPSARLLPRHYRELLWNPTSNPMLFWLTPGDWSELALRFEQMQRVVAKLHGTGVPILVGTDTMNPFVVPGASLHEEMQHLVAAGLPLETVWAAATREAGQALGVPGLGHLEAGAPADLLIFAADPSRDLAALGTLRAVVVGGRLYRRERIEAALERQRAHFDGVVYSSLYRALARLLIAAVVRMDG